MTYNIIGAMSGTSLDGLDIALCSFEHKKDNWKYAIKRATTYTYTKEWQDKLSNIHTQSALDLVKLHNEYGEFIGQSILSFLQNFTHSIDCIASHGHTIFHQPERNLTFQLGSGAVIAASTGIKTISDFRTLDLAFHGQGAPLVSIGDELLFSDYDYCLNLGGFANISLYQNGSRIAFDVCPVNIIINYITRQHGLNYDKDGLLAKAGQVHTKLLDELNSLDFYKKAPPKSLGREWLNEVFIPVVMKYKIDYTDVLRTIYDHIIHQITCSLSNNNHSIYITGGGAKNQFLVQLLKEKASNFRIIIPDEIIIDFKEALIFAFIGLLRYMKQINTLASATGAEKNSCGGSIFYI